MEVVSVNPAPVSQPIVAMAEAADRRRQSGGAPRAKASRSSGSSFDGDSNKPRIELVLYVSSDSAHSTAALRNLRQVLANFAGTSVKLTVHDLSKDPQRAERDGVHFTPSLVTNVHGPKTWIVGHLGNPQIVQALLESALERQE